MSEKRTQFSDGEERLEIEQLAHAFGVSPERAKQAQDDLGFLYRKLASPQARAGALEQIVSLGSADLSGEWEGGLRGVIRAMTDCARNALEADDRPEDRPDLSDTRWAVNVLLEAIAAKFEANPTLDLWRSDAADLVRSFKHDLATPHVMGRDAYPIGEKT